MMLVHRITSSLGLRPGNIRTLLNRETVRLALVGVSALGTVALSVQAVDATAATTTATFTVSAVVPAACTLTADSMSFGTYSGTAINTSSTITATCTASTPYTIALDAGLHPSTGGDTSTRRLAYNGAYIDYDLYSDSGNTTHWGNTGGADTVTGTGNGSSQAITVYGKLASGTVPAPGTYSDTVTATLTY